MPYVEGESLRERLDRETELGIEESVGIAGQVASALAYAHSKDIVHRDIKPENILLQMDQVVVADFGIALALDSAGERRLTETGLSLGTPAYMSPEQVAGEKKIDARSDIYSLACVLYEMLAGDPPFTASHPRAVLAKHVTDPAPSLTTVRPGVPAPVEAAVAKALGKSPADRFESAVRFAEALLAEELAAEPRRPPSSCSRSRT
jgi:serine/threonine protein kinase